MKRHFIIWVSIMSLSASVYALSLESAGVKSGFFTGTLKRQGHYEGAPILYSFNYDANEWLGRNQARSKGRLALCLEPFFNMVTRPNANVELGGNVLIRYAFALSEKIWPYANAGLGICFMTQHVDEQSTQFNFLPQIGAGIQYFIKPKVSVSLEYRYRHLSNSSIRQPNGGIDINAGLVGVTWHY